MMGERNELWGEANRRLVADREPRHSVLFGPNGEPLSPEEMIDTEAAADCPTGHENVVEGATDLRWCRDCKRNLPPKPRPRR